MTTAMPDPRGYFGEFGGRFVPETLVGALDELTAAYDQARQDTSFDRECELLLRDFAGRPTPLFHATRLTQYTGGAQIYLKREDLNHTGAHKINNAVGQALLARRIGKRRVIAETGAGQHGVAVAAACAQLGLDCRVFMGAKDVERQRPNVLRMRLLGAQVVPVHSGSQTLKDATNQAMREWVECVEDSHYIIGSVVGPHPYPTIVRDFQSVIGREARQQCVEQVGRLPDAVVACVGGGSNAIGIFHAFLDDPVRLIGVEAGGHGINTGEHAATLAAGRVGVLHGSRSYLLQDEDGQISETHSISAGMDYPGVGPELALLKHVGRVECANVTDAEALIAFRLLARLEGILPALESSHALVQAHSLAASMPADAVVLVNLSGRGDKDLDIVGGAV